MAETSEYALKALKNNGGGLKAGGKTSKSGKRTKIVIKDDEKKYKEVSRKAHPDAKSRKVRTKTKYYER